MSFRMEPDTIVPLAAFSDGQSPCRPQANRSWTVYGFLVRIPVRSKTRNRDGFSGKAQVDSDPGKSLGPVTVVRLEREDAAVQPRHHHPAVIHQPAAGHLPGRRKQSAGKQLPPAETRGTS